MVQSGTILQIGGVSPGQGWGMNAIEVREATDAIGWRWRVITNDEKQRLIDALNSVLPTRDGAEGANWHADFRSQCRAIGSAPPKPAPDAMREALEVEAKKQWPWDSTSAGVRRNIFIQGGLYATALSAPVPPASIHDAHDDIARGISHGEGEAVPPADGAIEIGRGRFRGTVAGMDCGDHEPVVIYRTGAGGLAVRTVEDFDNRTRETLLQSDSEPSPPCAGAAEPVAHYHRPSTMHMGDCSICGNVSDHPLHIGSPLYAAPPVRGDREAIARIIAGDIFGSPDSSVGPATQAARKDALVKADAILRQAPHSSSEGGR